MECKKEKNLRDCPCTYVPCSRKGVCCECIKYHWQNGELPACFFSPKAEKAYDRSVEKFISDWKSRKGKFNPF